MQRISDPGEVPSHKLIHREIPTPLLMIQALTSVTNEKAFEKYTTDSQYSFPE